MGAEDHTWRGLWRLSWPLVATMFLQFSVGLTDAYVAGNFGPAAQGAVGFAGQLLFVFSVVFLPLFLWFRQGAGRAALVWLGDRLASPGAVYLLAIPLMAAVALPNPGSPLGARNFGGWSLIGYMPAFFNGFLLVSHDRLYDGVQRLRWISLAVAVATTIGLLAWYKTAGEPRFGTAHYASLFALYGFSAWCWVLAILGLAARRLRFGKPFLAVANEAVLPFYVMHQSVLVTVGYFVVRWAAPDLAKWAVIMVTSFAICAVLYWFVIRPFNPLRFLFGMKRRAASPAE